MEVARAAQIDALLSAGETFRPRGEVYEQAATGSTLYTVRRPLGVHRAHHAVELPRRSPPGSSRPLCVRAIRPHVEAGTRSAADDATASRAVPLGEPASPALHVVVGRGGAVGGSLVAHPGPWQAISFHRRSVAVGERLRTDHAVAAGKRRPAPARGGETVPSYQGRRDADLERAVEACYAGAYLVLICVVRHPLNLNNLSVCPYNASLDFSDCFTRLVLLQPYASLTYM